MIENYFRNDLAIIFTGVVLLTAIPMGLTYLYKMKKSAMDADLKMKMLEMGMSANDIERVLAASSGPENDADDASMKWTGEKNNRA